MWRAGKTTLLHQVRGEAAARSGRANLGYALETAVLTELEGRRLDVTYVRTPQSYEVDFLARSADRRPELLRVCADP